MTNSIILRFSNIFWNSGSIGTKIMMWEFPICRRPLLSEPAEPYENSQFLAFTSRTIPFNIPVKILTRVPAAQKTCIDCTTCPPQPSLAILAPAHQGGISEFFCEAFLLDVVHPHRPILRSKCWVTWCQHVSTKADLQPPKFWKHQPSAREGLAEPPFVKRPWSSWKPCCKPFHMGNVYIYASNFGNL